MGGKPRNYHRQYIKFNGYELKSFELALHVREKWPDAQCGRKDLKKESCGHNCSKIAMFQPSFIFETSKVKFDQRRTSPFKYKFKLF